MRPKSSSLTPACHACTRRSYARKTARGRSSTRARAMAQGSTPRSSRSRLSPRSRCTTATRSTLARGRRSRSRSEIVRLEHAVKEHGGGKPRALLVLRQVPDTEAIEQDAQVRLDGIDAEEDL